MLNHKNLLFAIPLILGSVTKADLPPDSPVASILMKFSEGQKVLNDLNSTGKFSDVKIILLEQTEIEKRAGHNGGGVRQDPITKKYEILINKDISVNQKAHAIAHELQHIKDETAFDQFLESNPAINAIGPFVIKGLRDTNRSEFLVKNKDKVNFVMYGLFCQERRAYQSNINLSKQGLSFDTLEVIEKPAQYIFEKYVKKFGVEMTGKEISDLEKKCVNSESFLDFMSSVVPFSVVTKKDVSASAAK
ncbi:MAG: hypothetical protein SGJ18_01655 [Pseudomonadota bacterium]|nr:hypothetical protein [Pseudomonadota bacterium]